MKTQNNNYNIHTKQLYLHLNYPLKYQNGDCWFDISMAVQNSTKSQESKLKMYTKKKHFKSYKAFLLWEG